MTVTRGIFPAGGGIVRTLKNTKPKVSEKLRVLWKSEGFTPHAIAVHPRVPEQIFKDVRSAILSMGEDKEGQRLLHTIKFKKGLELAKNKDWDDVRALNIWLLDTSPATE